MFQSWLDDLKDAISAGITVFCFILFLGLGAATLLLLAYGLSVLL